MKIQNINNDYQKSFNARIKLKPANYEKIKTLGEYILVKENKEYEILDLSGNKISEIKYKKIRLNRNQLEGKDKKGKWNKIEKNI